jgi:hypothetical protein
MLSDFGFKEIRKYGMAEGCGPETIYFPITDEPDFPEEIRNKAEEMIRDALGRIKLQTASDNTALILKSYIVEPYIEIDIDDDEINYGIYVWIYDANNDGERLSADEYRINTDDPIYKVFKMCMLQQLEKSLFQ